MNYNYVKILLKDVNRLINYQTVSAKGLVFTVAKSLYDDIYTLSISFIKVVVSWAYVL